uniref:Secreted protein n=1 Tax=Rhipicephalus appendiculatus TaxID=34631 RepID=A0A131YA07_RHIAP
MPLLAYVIGLHACSVAAVFCCDQLTSCFCRDWPVGPGALCRWQCHYANVCCFPLTPSTTVREGCHGSVVSWQVACKCRTRGGALGYLSGILVVVHVQW